MPSSDRGLSEPPAYIPPGTFLGLPATRQTAGIDLAVAGIPFSSSGAGSQGAPAAIRAASVGVRPTNPARRANILRYCRAIDYGDLAVVPGLIQETYDRIEAGLRPLVEASVTPICMGGDHSVTLGQLRALRRRHGPLGIVLMDAHHDCYDGYYEGLVRYNAGTHLRRAIDEGLVDPTRSIIAGLRTFRDVQDDPAGAWTRYMDHRRYRRCAHCLHCGAYPGAARRWTGLPFLRHRRHGPVLRAGHGVAGYPAG